MHFYSISAAEAKKIGVGRKLIIETTEMEGNVALSDANNAEIASLNLSDGVVSMNWTEEMAALAVEGMRVRLSTGTNNIVRVYTTAPDPEYFIDVPSATEMYGMNIYQFAAGIFKDLPVGTVIGFYFTSSEGTPTLTDASNNTLSQTNCGMVRSGYVDARDGRCHCRWCTLAHEYQYQSACKNPILALSDERSYTLYRLPHGLTPSPFHLWSGGGGSS